MIFALKSKKQITPNLWQRLLLSPSILVSNQISFVWVIVHHVTGLPIHTSQPGLVCQSAAVARDQLVRSGVFNHNSHNSWCVM